LVNSDHAIGIRRCALLRRPVAHRGLHTVGSAQANRAWHTRHEVPAHLGDVRQQLRAAAQPPIQHHHLAVCRKSGREAVQQAHNHADLSFGRVVVGVTSPPRDGEGAVVGGDCHAHQASLGVESGFVYDEPEAFVGAAAGAQHEAGEVLLGGWEAEGTVGEEALEGAFGGVGSDEGLEGFGELWELALVGGEAGEQEFGGLFGFGFSELWVDGLDEALGLVYLGYVASGTSSVCEDGTRFFVRLSKTVV
jgi:hypothetical protein